MTPRTPTMYELPGVAKAYGSGARVVRRRRRRPRDRSRRVRRRRRAVGLRQDDAAAAARRARPADRRRRSGSRARTSPRMSATASSPAAARRVGFVFQQFNLIPTLTAAQNVEVALAPTAAARPPTGASARDELLDRVGLGRARGPPALAALGRRAAARGDRPRARQRPARPARRRADRQPRHATGDEILALLRDSRRRRPDGRADHPRPGDRRVARRASCACATAAFEGARGPAPRR